MHQLKGNRAVVSLDDYRQSKTGNLRPSISMDLHEDGGMNINLNSIDAKNAYQAAVACYLAMGKVLKVMQEDD